MQIILIAIVQAITEILPVSSSTHQIIISKLFNFSNIISPAIIVILHLGSAIGLTICYRKLIFRLSYDTFENFIKICLVLIPSIIIMLFVKYLNLDLNIIQQYKSINMFIGGLLLLLIYKTIRHTTKYDYHQISYYDSIIIGTFQLLAIFSGFSRLGSNLIACRILKIDTKISINFSLIASIPTIILSNVYQLLTCKNHFLLYFIDWNIIIAVTITIFTTIILFKTMYKLLTNYLIHIIYYKLVIAIIFIYYNVILQS